MTPHQPTDRTQTYQRVALAFIAAALAGVAFYFRYGGAFDQTTALWVYHSLLKVAIALIACSLAWPQILRLRQSAYGQLVLIGLLVAGMFFMIKPKAMVAVLPILVAAVVVLCGLTFLRNVLTRSR